MKAVWQSCQLGDVATLSGRIGWRGLTAKEYTREGPWFLSVHSLNHGDQVDFREAFHISQARFDESPEIMLRRGDVLICKDGAGIGKLGIVGELPGPSTINSSLLLIRAGERLRPKFLYHCLCSPYFQRIVQSRLNGATTPHLYQRDITEFPVVIPPLDEQDRIVAILDEAFEGIATAKANAEKNLQNARELFESALDAALSRHDRDFVQTALGDEVDLVAGFAFSSKGYTDAASGVRLLRGDNIMQGYLRWEDAKHWPTSDAAPYARFALREGDVVLAMDRPWVKAGLKRAQIGANDLPCLQLQRTARLRARRRMSADFLYHLTASQSFSRHLLSVQTGLGVPHISGKQIESFRFMLPPPNEQKTIAGTLDDLQRMSQRLEEICQQKVSALDELKKALLHRAFNGALTEKSIDKQVAEVV